MFPSFGLIDVSISVFIDCLFVRFLQSLIELLKLCFLRLPVPVQLHQSLSPFRIKGLDLFWLLLAECFFDQLRTSVPIKLAVSLVELSC